MSIPKPKSCEGCALYSSSSGFSSLEGSGSSGLLVVAEALGEHEEEDGLPLRPYAPTGMVFQRALDELHIDRKSLTLTNTIRCQPPDNELRGTPYEWSALNHCKQYLNEALELRRPKAILALGAVPLRELLDSDSDVPADLTSVRGFLLRSKYSGIPLISTYHPAFLVRGNMHLMSALLPDIKFAYRVATIGAPKPVETHYELSPSIDDVRAFYLYLRDNPALAISYDVETAELLGERDEADWRRKRIIQIQFSDRPGRAIVLPWEGRYIDAAKAILALDNPKWGWNSRLSDDLALRGAGCTLNGELHDLMNAMIHLQPSFTAGRDDKFGEKGIATKLLGLQSAASFFCPEVGPWKHLAWRGAETMPLYGAYDADYTMHVGIGIFESLRTAGIYEGYETFKRSLCSVLDEIAAIGLPIDREKQADLRTYTISELERLQTDLQPQIPLELRTVHPEAGWKGIPRSLCTADGLLTKLSEVIENYDRFDQPPYIVIGDPNKPRKSAPTEGHLIERPFTYQDEQGANHIARRWCLLKPFNPGSPGENGQVGRYINYRGYPMPTKIDDPSKGTVGKGELERLAAKVHDPVLDLIVQYKDIRKTGMDYTGGVWVPGSDGRVHSTLRPNTASGQTTASAPNIQQFPDHTGLAKRAKAMIAAEPGHMLVKIDMRGFHSRVIGFLANDPIYYRLADFDVHSYITAHFLKLHDAPYLDDMDDQELRAALGAIKAQHSHTRNFKVKRTVHGRQFGLGINKLYKMHSDNFDPKPEEMPGIVGDKWYGWNAEQQARAIASAGRTEATKLFYLFDRLFPKTFIEYPALIAAKIGSGPSRCRLVTPYGCHRYFWDYDKEQSNAFGPSNCAHCEIQLALIRLKSMDALRAFEAVNFPHDALWLHPLERDVDECVRTVQAEFERPSTVLISPTLGAFYCNSDAEVGSDMTQMEAYGK